MKSKTYDSQFTRQNAIYLCICLLHYIWCRLILQLVSNAWWGMSRSKFYSLGAILPIPFTGQICTSVRKSPQLSESMSRNGSGTAFTARKWPTLFRCSFSNLFIKKLSISQGFLFTISLLSRKKIILEAESSKMIHNSFLLMIHPLLLFKIYLFIYFQILFKIH